MEKEKNIDKLMDELLETLLSIKNKNDLHNFLKDLCTPQELISLAERWYVCKLLHQADLSYREISSLTGASLATITRVARFLKDEPYQGYRSVLKKMDKS